MHSIICNTDASGYVNQHLQYMPFGETFVDQRKTGHDVRFKFTGKERDNEIKPIGADSLNTFENKQGMNQPGYRYFGARYYDSGVSVWLSVDPLADKYPSQSPYSYVGNRPTMVIDPNGMNEWIPPTEEGGAWTAEAGDSPGSLARDAGISQSEAEGIMRDYNASNGNNRSSDIMVYKGDKVSVSGSVSSGNSSSVASSTSASTPSNSGNSNTNTSNNSPVLDFELNINFGGAFKEKVNVFGFNEKVEINAFSVDLMTWNWNSSKPLNVEYTPYRSAYSSVDYGLLNLGGGASYDWSNNQGSAHGHIGMLEANTNNATRFTVFDIGGQYGFGINVKMTANPQKVMRAVIQQQAEWNNRVGYMYYPFLH
jgi:RHS repeat-associated protein